MAGVGEEGSCRGCWGLRRELEGWLVEVDRLLELLKGKERMIETLMAEVKDGRVGGGKRGGQYAVHGERCQCIGCRSGRAEGG